MWAMYECEHCGFTMQKIAYANKNFYKDLLPRMKCPMCNKRSTDLKGDD